MSSINSLHAFSFRNRLMINTWPPIKDLVVHIDKEFVKVIITQDGRIVVQTIFGENNKFWTAISQPVRLMHTMNLFSLKQRGIELDLFDFDFEVDAKENGQVLFKVNGINVKDSKTSTIQVVPINFYIIKQKKYYEDIDVKSLGVDTNYNLFLHTMKDLDNKAYSGSDYDLLKASGLVRFLIAEDKPGEDRPGNSFGLLVADELQIPMNFQIEKPMVEVFTPSGEESMRVQSIYTNRYPPLPQITLDVDAFLDANVIYRNHDISTVFHVIKTLSEVSGGIHKGEPKSMKLEKGRIVNFDSRYVGPLPMSISIMKGICSVILETFKPVVEAIVKQM